MLSFNRSTQDILGFTGDVFGLYFFLVIVLKFLMMPITAFKRDNFLLTSLFRMTPRSIDQNTLLTSNLTESKESKLT